MQSKCLLVVLITTGSSTLSSASASHTARSALTVRRFQGQVNVLLGVNSDQERRHIHNLLANTDMSLSDQDTSVVDRLSKSLLENFSLETAFHESLGGEGKDVLKGVLLISQKSISLKTADKGSSLEDTLGVLRVKSQKGTGGLSDFGKDKLHTPDLSLATKTVFTTELKLLVKTFLLVRTADRSKGLAVVGAKCDVGHI
mmetsp:Transcript_13476/g.22116  ORF Transcript_13476/g.22116 Transcript_13476/m.22116 type:complete len:200 (-) Transcript_13476:28-627(-)